MGHLPIAQPPAWRPGVAIRLAFHPKPAQDPPGMEVQTDIASCLIKAHKPPHHIKAQHLGRFLGGYQVAVCIKCLLCFVWCLDQKIW